MKSSWELTYQNAALLLICVGLFIGLMGVNLDRDNADIRIKCLQLERDVLDSAIAASEARNVAHTATLDSLAVRDSILVIALGKTKEFKLINDTTISNDSLRSLFARRGRTGR
jgi:hypothetical protein